MSDARRSFSVRWWGRLAGALGVLAAAIGCLGWSGLALAQDGQSRRLHAKPSRAESHSPGAEKGTTEQAEFGMVLKAEGGGLKNVSATVTVPMDWPGQQRVRVVQEDLPPGATVSYKTVDDIGRQMVVKFPLVSAGQEIRAVVTFEVEQMTPPAVTDDAGQLAAPDPQSLSRRVAIHLAPSPKIESDHPQVRKAAEEALGSRTGAWEKVQAIHQWVHTNIAFSGGLENVRTCMQTLDSRRGVCAEMNSLAVAMLRAVRLPARLVRVPGHCYYEVYLLDSQDKGHWFVGDASAAATITPSGSAKGMILQKGDNVSVIDPNTKRRTKGRFLAETVTGTPLTKSARLQFQPISPALTTAPRTPTSHKDKSE